MFAAKLLVLLAVVCAASAQTQPQSVLAFVDVGGQLDQVFNEHLPQWIALLNTIKLPDVKTSGSGFDIDLTALNLGNFAIASVTTTGSNTGVFNFNINGVGATLNLNFHAREHGWPHIADHGSAKATFSGGSVSGQIVLSVSAGSLQVAVTAASCSLNNFNLDIHSSLSWLYDLLMGLIKGSIKDAAQDALRDAIKSAIPEYANPYLVSIPKTVPLHIGYSNITIADLTLDTSIQAVTGSAEDFLLTTSAMPKDVTAQCPYPASFVHGATLKEGSLATVAVDEAIFNCFAWDVFNQGQLKYLLTPENFKQDVLPLNTTAWKDYAPPLPAKYPNLGMQILARAADIPTLSIAPGPTINVTLNAFLDVSVINTDGSIVPAFTLEANLTGSANGLQAHVEKQLTINITALIADGGCKVGLHSSQIGTFDTTALSGIFDFGTKIGLSYVASILADGFSFKVPLPPPLIMTVAGVDAEQGYLRVYAATAPPLFLQ